MALNIENLKKLIAEMSNDRYSRFARAAGISVSAMKKWLEGRSSPSFKNMQRLLKYTGKPESYFITPEDGAPDQGVQSDDSDTRSNNTLWGLPVSESWKRGQAVTPDSPEDYHKILDEILACSEAKTVNAVIAMLKECHAKIAEKQAAADELRSMRAEKQALIEKIERLEAGDKIVKIEKSANT